MAWCLQTKNLALFAHKSAESNKSNLGIEVLDMDGEKIVIQKQDEVANVSTNSGSWKGEVPTNSGMSLEGDVTEDTKPVIGVVMKVEMEAKVDGVAGDLEMKSECQKCHLRQVKDEVDRDKNIKGECCKCDLQQLKDKDSDDNARHSDRSTGK